MMDENFFLARTKWVDKSKRCQRQSRACETCTRTCGTDMPSGDAQCGVTGDDSDNGLSPRLMMCYNCCVKKNCSVDCKDYHKNTCQPQQCIKGNLMKFSLKPSWVSSEEGRYFCHIKPSHHQYLLNLDYSVKVAGRRQEGEGAARRGRGRNRGGNRRRGKGRNKKEKDVELRKKTIMIYGDDDWIKTGAMTYSDDILDISINSSLGSPPNIVEGNQNSRNVFKVGDYKSKGTRFADDYVPRDYAYLRPPTPHETPDMPQAQQECSVPKLADMLFTSNMENPYIERSGFEATADDMSLPFTVRNKKMAPVVLATLDRDTSILQNLFQPARVLEESFRGDVTHNGSHWVVEVSGEVDVCPGFLRIKVSNPARPAIPMFDCDTAILCPPQFNLTFALPTSDLEGMYKDVLVQVKDNRHEHNFRLFRRTSLEESEEEVDLAKELESVRARPSHDPTAQAMRSSGSGDGADSDSGSQTASNQTPDLPLPIYALLVIAGGILLLLVLAIIGQCFLADFPIPDTPYAQLHHAFFAVCYMMLQFVYSLFISGTAFFLILTIITSRDVNFIVRHGQPGAVSTAASNIELLRLQRHLEGEITRQDTLADAAQEMCIRDVYKISQDMQQLHEALLNSTHDVFERHRLDLLLTQQKIHVRQRLTQDLNKFRESYTKAARAVLMQVNQNAQASYQHVEQNITWLDGARFLHGTVKLYRNTHQKPVKSFMEWTGIRAELKKLEIDLSFSLPALPRLDDIPAPPPDKQPIKRDTGPEFPELDPIRSIQMHNNWFFPVEEMGIGGAASFISLDHEETRPDTAPQSVTSAAFYVFLVLLVLCDLVLLGHRMCTAWTTAKLCVYGFPEYFRENKEAEMGNDDVFASRESKLTPAQGCKDSPIYQSVALFLTQTISTTFFPKIVGAIATCVVMVCVLQLSNQYLTLQELEKAGLYHSAEQYLDLQTSLTNARLTGHATHINTLHFPAFQASVSGHLARHQAVLSIYRKQLLGLQSLSMRMYCEHLKAIDLQAQCSHLTDQISDDNSQAWDKMATMIHACKFYPVVPRLYVRGEDEYIPTSVVQIEAVLESLRHIIFLTARLVTIFLVTVVVKELLCAVAWIFLQRSGAIRIRVIVERDQDEGLQ
ncbi:delta-like protein 2 [Plakobranchus ocellatus]|uniref:Delta-like protein 2 n=1 Tax=Plakobranchus ocellatus TaxID=259542 RepID=A0AAV3XYU2_9GAST|nr:delta-like protein 2 [Plakobranchus ocellatus]